jgi:hypothetical protein
MIMSDTKRNPDELAPEYDISESRPNPYAERFESGTIMVRLDPDVARVFPDSEAVNEALRALVKIIDRRSDAA